MAPPHRHGTESSGQGEAVGCCRQTSDVKLRIRRSDQTTTAKRFSPIRFITCRVAGCDWEGLPSHSASAMPLGADAPALTSTPAHIHGVYQSERFGSIPSV